MYSGILGNNTKNCGKSIYTANALPNSQLM